ncbi:hypothetical protein [Fretibacterium sp. OH1220_COT-178]|uniref:hypothetical protein n=1 Tax=Fretibacterium sp. OH1220_COT-178 TaxID=2491047 RepID=UPI001F2B58F3|nr:hypothetical protein [Fretibacterium sp. OH1220_COT-178]
MNKKASALQAILFCFCACLCFAESAFAGETGTEAAPRLSDRRELPPLEQLEPGIGDGPEALAALAALARDGHILQVEAERLSPRLFAGVTYGYSDEPLSATDDERHAYGKLSGTVGVSFPLLGTWTRQKIERIRADLARTESRYRSELIRYNNLLALRKAYAVLWSEGKRRPILETFLADEARVLGILSERAGKHLLLDSDLLEFASAFDMVRRDIVASKLNVSRALATIAAATGRRWDLPERVERPLLPGMSELALRLSGHPELRGREEAVRLHEEIAGLAKRNDRDAHLDMGLTAARDFPGTWGAGAHVGLSVREPFGSLSSRSDGAREAAQSDLERARWDVVSTEMRLQDNFEEQLLWNDYARESLRVGTTRLEAAQANVRERTLRFQSLPGDTFEQLQRGRYALLRTAMDVIDAESLALQTYIELLAFFASEGDEDESRVFPLGDTERRDLLLAFPPLPHPELPSLPPRAPAAAMPQSGEGRMPSSSPHPASKSVKPLQSPEMALANRNKPEDAPTAPAPKPLQNRKAVYAWRAAPLLSEATRTESLARLKRDGFDRILLSFSPQEVQGLRNSEGAEGLRALLRHASREGVIVDLLLGDPAWILPEAREGLEGVLRFLAPFPFRSVHLDLEPDMLPNAERNRDTLSTHLLDTLRMALIVVGRPIELVVHPRYLEGELGEKMAGALVEMGISDLAVMIYSTNMDAVADRFKAICRAHPRLRFALVQSVEKGLSRSESYFEAGRDGFEKRMQRLRESIGTEGLSNFAGLIVQSREDYILMSK